MVKLEHTERFLLPEAFTKEKLEDAKNRAVARVARNIEKFGSQIFETIRDRNNRYEVTDRISWTAGLGTGLYWLAYEMTRDEKFLEVAKKQSELYTQLAEDKDRSQGHDVGFRFIPSIVAEYKVTGNKDACDTGIKAARILLNQYSWKGNFIIRVGDGTSNFGWNHCRTMVDSMMNNCLYLWAYEETKEEKFLEAGVGHYRTTMKYLIREDGSSYHHYQFKPDTNEPVGGCTLQGRSDESCWSRGQSWLVYGFPIAYSYTKDSETLETAKNVTNYFLNHLPSDYIPYWDFDFGEGSLEPRDSSAAAVAVCGLLELCQHLPEDSEERRVYMNAACCMMNALIDKCEITSDEEDGLIAHVTAHKRRNYSDSIATYGDYFYLEALMRFTNPDWKRYW